MNEGMSGESTYKTGIQRLKKKQFKCKINTKTNVRLVAKQNVNVNAMKI